jgi:hypothetical protein
MEEVGPWDVAAEVARESIQWTKWQTYPWMGALVVLSVVIFIVLAVTHAPAVAYAIWGVFMLVAAVTGTAHSKVGLPEGGEADRSLATQPRDQEGGQAED